MSNEDYKSSVTSAKSWSERLTRTREARGMDIKEAAKELNLSSHYLVKLESGSLNGLPSMVFIRGYIRSYARLLELNEQQLLHEFELIHGKVVDVEPIQPITNINRQIKAGDPLMKLASWIFGLMIIGISVWWWQTQNSSNVDLIDKSQNTETPASIVEEQIEPNSANLEPVEPEPAQNSTANLKIEQQDLQQVTTADELLDEAADAAKKEKTAEIKAAERQPIIPPASTSETIVVSKGELYMVFREECWISIKDADGKTLFNNLRGQGQKIKLSGKPPIRVLIGAVSAVKTITYNGDDVELASHNRNNIARLHLPIVE